MLELVARIHFQLLDRGWSIKTIFVHVVRVLFLQQRDITFLVWVGLDATAHLGTIPGLAHAAVTPASHRAVIHHSTRVEAARTDVDHFLRAVFRISDEDVAMYRRRAVPKLLSWWEGRRRGQLINVSTNRLVALAVKTTHA